MLNQRYPPSHHPTILKTCFFGTPRFAQIVLGKLIDSAYKPRLVITSPDAKIGRGQKLQPSPVKQTTLTHHIEVFQPESFRESNVKGQLSIVQPDLAILVAYGKIIPKEILEIPKFGFVNIHPSLLPKYRGPSPIQSAILAGERKTGVTIMLLDEKVDHGPILAQKEVEIKKTDTHASLIEKIGKIGAEILIETLPYYISGDLTPKAQNHSKATFTKHIKKGNGYIDLANPPDPQTLDRMIRAYYPWPTVWSKWKIRERIFDKSKRENGKWKIIKFLPPTILPSYKPTDPFVIQPEGKKSMTVKEFKNGYPEIKVLIEKLLRPQQ